MVEATDVRQPDRGEAERRRCYSVPDAADILGMSARYVWALLREGTLNPVRLGHRTFVRDDELAALIERNTDRGLG